mgnify:CR=1 FL=1
MAYWYVETWTVLREKLEEHEVALKRWTDYLLPRLKAGNYWYLWNRQGPIGGRIFIKEFENFTHFENTMEVMNRDEENIKLRGAWRSCIDTGSWRSTFWSKMAVK